MSDRTPTASPLPRRAVGRDAASLVLWLIWAWPFVGLYVGSSLTRFWFVVSLLVSAVLGVGFDHWVRGTDRGRSFRDRYRKAWYGYRFVVAAAAVTASVVVLVLAVWVTNAPWLALAFQAASLTGALAFRLAGSARRRSP